ncbi:hypothetical protein SORBI_3001G446850 [Sorghum bicolor]|uniref:Uncharacterized protein n=1 Tax=Sorghum bicolor TaxID=4558 RepID=A0A1Z5SAS6_SORBI|nr:hypothetical protein SORBI_3001G446850 [Sorghum bicolor]
MTCKATPSKARAAFHPRRTRREPCAHLPPWTTRSGFHRPRAALDRPPPPPPLRRVPGIPALLRPFPRIPALRLRFCQEQNRIPRRYLRAPAKHSTTQRDR